MEKHGVECEFTPRPTVDVCLTESFADYEAQALARAKAAGVDVRSVEVLDDAETVKVGDAAYLAPGPC